MPTRPAILLGVLLAASVVTGLAGTTLAADAAALRVSVLVVAPCAPPAPDGPAAACAVPDEPGPLVLGARFPSRPSPTVPGLVATRHGG